jgi:uncharacterized repeat protein (TIGR01451 family)
MDGRSRNLKMTMKIWGKMGVCAEAFAVLSACLPYAAQSAGRGAISAGTRPPLGGAAAWLSSCMQRAGSFALMALTVLMVTLLPASWFDAMAAGTPAGTTITNSASVNYTVGGTTFTQNTQPVAFRVDELISVRVTPPASPASVNSPDSNRALLFTVTNVGNAPEAYTLTPNLNPGAPVVDQFNPSPGSVGQLFVDVNGNGQLDIGVDTLISGPVTLNPDATLQVLLVSNMPAGLANGNLGVVTLTAASATPGAIVAGVGVPPGTTLTNGGTPAVGGPGIDAVIGAGRNGAADSGADDSANGTYLVGTVAVSIAKTVISVTSPLGVITSGCNVAVPPAPCNTIVPGTVVQYQLTVTLAGSGTAQAVQVTDDIPANTTYVANSIRFNATPRTDQADADNASCPACGNAVGTVTVVIGDVTVTAGSPLTYLIDYKVSIN